MHHFHFVSASRIRPLAACLAVLLGTAGSSFAADSSRVSGHAAASHERRVESPRAPVIRVVDSCSEAALRQAIANAGDGDIINAPMGCSRITLTAGAIPITVNNLTLDGPGADALTIDGGASAGVYDRVFRHYGAGTFTISDVTIADASLLDSTDARGGCIDSQGTVYLLRSTVAGCYLRSATNFGARGGGVYAKNGVQLYLSTVTTSEAMSQNSFANGGGIFSYGYLEVERSTISDNAAESTIATHSNGGGVATVNGDVIIRDSTISGNEAGNGGGLHCLDYSAGHSALITNTTLSGNYALAYVGGASLQLPTTISNSTVASNRSASALLGVGVYARDTFTAESSIFSNNLTPMEDASVDVFVSSGAIGGEKNIIVHTSSPAPGDTLSVCPRLGPLTNNGGPTWTHALLSGSPAIDMGDNPLNHEFDQRLDGFTRTFGVAADIGAYEWQGDAQDELFSSRFEYACD